jgi:hypothetical protein
MMLRIPNTVGLILCEQVVVAEKTRNVTLVNCLNRVRCTTFPSPPQRFVAFAVLTDGRGNATMTLAVDELDTRESVYQASWPMTFRDPLRDIRLILRLPALSFPEPGRYEFSLTADGELVAHTVLQLDEEE